MALGKGFFRNCYLSAIIIMNEMTGVKIITRIRQ
jgi:hypothetical protein